MCRPVHPGWPHPNLSLQGKWGMAAWGGWWLKGGEGAKWVAWQCSQHLEVTAQVRVPPPHPPHHQPRATPGTRAQARLWGEQSLALSGACPAAQRTVILWPWAHPGTQWEAQRLWGGLWGAVPVDIDARQPLARPGASSPGRRAEVTGAPWGCAAPEVLAFQEAGCCLPARLPRPPLTLVVKDAVFP